MGPLFIHPYLRRLEYQSFQIKIKNVNFLVIYRLTVCKKFLALSAELDSAGQEETLEYADLLTASYFFPKNLFCALLVSSSLL